jgi:hypothetical protein
MFHAFPLTQLRYPEETWRREFVLELCDSEAIVIHRVSFRAREPVDYGFDD